MDQSTSTLLDADPVGPGASQLSLSELITEGSLPRVPAEGLHVCLVSQEYPPETAHGGIGSQTFLKAHGLSALGCRVHVISRSTDRETHEYDNGRVRVTRIAGFEHQFPVHTTEADWLTYSVKVAATIADIHSRSPLDLIDFPEWGCEGYVHLLNRTRWNHIPTVVHLHGPLVMFAHAIGWPDVDSEFYRAGIAMEGACIRLADRVYSSSHCSAEWCSRHYGLAIDRAPVLHMGIDADLFQPRAVCRETEPTIVFVGNISENKGVSLLVDAAISIAPEFPGLKVELIGKGNPDLVNHLRRVAVAAGFDDLLNFVGFIPRAELPDHLSRAHVLAVPSCYEGGPGFVYLEGMACGLPVIACSGSGAAEVVTPGVSGLLVPPHDLPALTEALRSLLGNPDLRYALGAAGFHYVQTEANTRTCARRLLEFYASVVAEYSTVERASHA